MAKKKEALIKVETSIALDFGAILREETAKVVEDFHKILEEDRGYKASQVNHIVSETLAEIQRREYTFNKIIKGLVNSFERIDITSSEVHAVFYNLEKHFLNAMKCADERQKTNDRETFNFVAIIIGDMAKEYFYEEIKKHSSKDLTQRLIDLDEMQTKFNDPNVTYNPEFYKFIIKAVSELYEDTDKEIILKQKQGEIRKIKAVPELEGAGAKEVSGLSVPAKADEILPGTQKERFLALKILLSISNADQRDKAKFMSFLTGGSWKGLEQAFSTYKRWGDAEARLKRAVENLGLLYMENDTRIQREISNTHGTIKKFLNPSPKSTPKNSN